MVEQHEKALVPEIRFAGFTDPWEQRKVRDFLSESRVKGNTGLNSRKLTVKLWGKGVIEKNDFGGSEHTQYFIRHKGQFIYSKLDFLNSAFGVIPEKLDGYESTADLPAFDLVEMNPHFMFFTAVQEGFYLKHGSAADGSRKAKRIHVNTFLEMPIMVPTVAEQDLIVEYLQSLDCLITLHQRKYDKLCVLKKSMLDKMFPKGGSLYPEIRFAGFTDPWEQRKLGELCSFSKGYGYSKNNLRDQGTPIILYGRLYTNYETQIHSVDTFVDPLENSVYTEGGEVIVPASGETAEDISIASVVEKPGIILGGDLNIITPSAVVNPVFLALELSYGKPHFDLAKRAQGKSVVHIHNEDIANVFFDRPCIAEQRRIGGFFDRLDSLITLHQRKLELLRNIKKSMLDKMFV